MLVIFRFVAHIPIPGVNPALLKQAFEGNTSTGAFLGTLNLFSGGALRQLSVAALGVYPYITASIIMQILIAVIPSLQALSREGEAGRNQIQLYTHWLAVPMAFVQGYSQLLILQQAGAVSGIGFTGPDALPTLAAVISMTAGTMFLVWLGELITEKGIGNGISLIIFGGIVAGIPSLLPQVFDSSVSASSASSSWRLIVLVAVVVDRLLPGGAAPHPGAVLADAVPRRPAVPPAGRDPHPAARALRRHDPDHLRLLDHAVPVVHRARRWRPQRAASSNDIGNFLTDVFGQRNVPYYLVVFLFVVLFTYFYTFVTFQQQNLAENLQKQGGFIPGIRPGAPTDDYITRVLIRITCGRRVLPGRDRRDAVLRDDADQRAGADDQRHRPADRRGRGAGHDEAAGGAADDAQLLRVHSLRERQMCI